MIKKTKIFDEFRGVQRLVISDISQQRKFILLTLRISYAEVLMILQNRHSETDGKIFLSPRAEKSKIDCLQFLVYLLLDLFIIFTSFSATISFSMVREHKKNNNSNNKRESKLFPYTIRHNSKRCEEIKKSNRKRKNFFRLSLCLQRNIPSFLLNVISGRVGKGVPGNRGGGILR
ncbi:hypothetical protein CEXT_346071 [Caerostris extrusa]|uniref:Uncharacterized protein n=1 Tax=Caerostris extrusa TaxID=172846 RepID=A0AAV4SXT1_CAEEX|nr:hypothetical protein CEXT_346071 [Caerostris extrusa]